MGVRSRVRYSVTAVMATLAVSMAAGAQDFTAISTLVNEAIAAKKLPGAVVVVGHGGKVVFRQAYGERKLAGEPGPKGETEAEPMTVDTVFDMASLTKCLATATAVMQLYEEGKFEFDDPVAKYLPEFAANGKEQVTIRELLTHYSGLPPDVDLKDAWGLAAFDKPEGLRRMYAAKLVTTPGTHEEYSDINYIALGALVERLSGLTLDLYAKERIFVPLKMTHTAFLPNALVCDQFRRVGSAISFDPTRRKSVECADGLWSGDLILNIAPTTHDNEGDAATNPDFDRLLRGTVHDPTTRRMGGVAGQAGVFSTAADMSLFAQAVLDKLIRNRGTFPLKQATMKLMTQPEQPKTAETGATIFTGDGKTTKGVAARGFGWDINSAYSRPRGEVFPIGSFGHTGFTGTSVWMDPGSNSYVILLANSIHPRGNASISGLRGQVATAAAKALGVDPNESETIVAKHSPTKTGIDVLEATNFAAVKQAGHGGVVRVGLLTNQTGVDSGGRRTIDVLKAAPGVKLVTLFSPEHGIAGAKDSMEVKSGVDKASGLPVISLYGPKDEDKRPRVKDLAGLDAVVIDLQDAGVRFYTYEAVTGYFLEAAAKARTQVVVLDRPDLVGGEYVQGPVSDPGKESYTNYRPVPVRHGMTLGELAKFYNGEGQIGAKLTVVPMEGWQRTEYFDETELKWVNPSPNLRSIAAAALYPGVGLLDFTNVSVGRGTETPFEQIGADYIKSAELLSFLKVRKVPGVKFTATKFKVAEDENHYPYHGQEIEGVAMVVEDRNALDAPELGIELAAALHALYPKQFKMAGLGTLIVSQATMDALAKFKNPRDIAATWEDGLAAFRVRREQYLIYQ